MAPEHRPDPVHPRPQTPRRGARDVLAVRQASGSARRTSSTTSTSRATCSPSPGGSSTSCSWPRARSFWSKLRLLRGLTRLPNQKNPRDPSKAGRPTEGDHSQAKRPRGDLVRLRPAGRVLQAVARQEHALHLRVLRVARREPRRRPDAEDRLHLPEAPAEAGREVRGLRLRLGRAGDPRGQALRRPGDRA